MLNELYELNHSLSDAKVATSLRHEHFQPCPKRKTFLVLLSEDGRAVDLEPIKELDRITAVRTYSVESGVSFPAFNVLPLLKPRNERVRQLAAEFKKALGANALPPPDWIATRLRRLVRLSNSLWTKKEPRRINKCLATLSNKLAEMLGTPPQEYAAISALVARSAQLTSDALHGQLQEIVIRRMEQTAGDAGNWIDLLFFQSGKTPRKVSLILELADRSAFAFPATHAAIQSWMKDRFQAAKVIAPAPSGKHDAYANPAESLADTFPAVRMNVLGNVILRSMSSESPCQRRYGAADSCSFPVGRETRQMMQNALGWISEHERRGKTWCDVSSVGGTSAVLFAYPSQRPEVATELAGMFAGTEDFSDPTGSRFEACAARVTQTLRGQLSDKPGTEIRIFILSKRKGDARTKALHSGRYSVERLIESAELWQRNARNIPTVRIRQFGPAKGDKPVWTEPLIPFPGEIVWCLNAAWEQMGTRPEQVHGFEMSDGLTLLLERDVTLRTTAKRAVRVLIQNSLSLVLALGQAHHQGSVHPLGKKYGKQALLLPSILGLLLAKIGRLKGEYMKGPPFLVGRMLSLADQLHVQYCVKVRKNQIPPQLVGNSLMATALEQPSKALALLCQRILPYQAWARTVQGGDEVRLAKYLLGELGRVSAELKEHELPTRCGDPDKAEMLLGYLARSEKQEDVNPSPANAPKGESP